MTGNGGKRKEEEGNGMENEAGGIEALGYLSGLCPILERFQ